MKLWRPRGNSAAETLCSGSEDSQCKPQYVSGYTFKARFVARIGKIILLFLLKTRTPRNFEILILKCQFSQCYKFKCQCQRFVKKRSNLIKKPQPDQGATHSIGLLYKAFGKR